MFSQSLEGLLILSLPTFFQVSSGCSVNCVSQRLHDLGHFYIAVPMSLVPLIPKSSAGSIITPPFSNACLRTYKPGRGDFVPALSPILEYVGPPFLHPFRIAGTVLHLVYWNRGKRKSSAADNNASAARTIVVPSRALREPSLRRFPNKPIAHPLQ